MTIQDIGRAKALLRLGQTDDSACHCVLGIFPNRSRGGYNDVLGRLS